MLKIMPMTNDSTTKSPDDIEVKIMKSPKSVTLELIRQFAHSCNVLKDMSFDVMMAN